MYSHKLAAPNEVRLRFGTFDVDPGVRPALHYAVESKAPWHEITDALPQIESQDKK